MPELSIILAGMGDALQPVNILFVLAGVIIGQFVGAVPGIGPVMTMAIAIPFTFGLDPLAGIGFLVGVNKGGLVGGGDPGSVAEHPRNAGCGGHGAGRLSAGQARQAAEGDQDGAVFLGHR